jgi:hypothetical protein
VTTASTTTCTLTTQVSLVYTPRIEPSKTRSLNPRNPGLWGIWGIPDPGRRLIPDLGLHNIHYRALKRPLTMPRPSSAGRRPASKHFAERNAAAWTTGEDKSSGCGKTLTSLEG